MDEKWCESWEKNFDSTLKALNKFKDDVKEKPKLSELTERRCRLYLDLLSVEIEDILFKFKNSSIKKEG